MLKDQIMHFFLQHFKEITRADQPESVICFFPRPSAQCDSAFVGGFWFCKLIDLFFKRKKAKITSVDFTEEDFQRMFFYFIFGLGCLCVCVFFFILHF